ncbi:MAG TPA: hypothetical protein DCK93_16335 [Blastocatellia bacterium]|nr:hypothetical protein [Blastocatellia bacterium]HAF24445.1 hypothetical protein [Blastocatellia bacterium]
MNYFNYFTEIEDAFIRRRGKHLLLSPMDWALIESWKEMNVPLHVALRGIEKSFDSWESKPRKRTVKSLLYCQEEVEAQFAEWRESRVGAAGEPGDSQDENGAQQENEGLPFTRAAILEHLQRSQSSLMQARKERISAGEDDFSDALQRATALLADLEQEFAAVALLDAQKLEHSLSGLERMLSDSISSVVESAQLETIEKEVKDQLNPYRKQMEAEVYQQTFDNLLLKRLREQFGLPRLSLFYL